MDRFSPVAPAFIRVQVLPVGRIDRARFLDIVESLRRHHAIISLADLDSRDIQLNSLSPAAFPQGSLLFNYTTTTSAEQYQSFAPFELFREPLLIVGIVDGLGEDADDKREELGRATEYLRERYPRVVDRQLFVIQEDRHGFPVGADSVTPIQEGGLETAVRSMSSRFLGEFGTYAQATQAMPNVQTPGAAARLPRKAPPMPLEEGNTSSRPSTPNNFGMGSPIKDGSPMHSPTRSVASPPPATNFDQINAHRPGTNGISRSDSRASTISRGSNRASSQERHERLPSQGGFGPNTSAEKARTRGKARVGIVTGYIHLMAGQWNETLRLLIEHTNKARTLGDHIWYAKGLEGLAVCLILLAWRGVEFSIPTICYSHADRTKFKRLSQDKDHVNGQDLSSVDRLSHLLPELTRMILNLYKAGEGQLELPYLVIAETNLRFAKILASMHQSAGSLDTSALEFCVQGLAPTLIRLTPSTTKASIVEMLTHVHTAELDLLPIVDRIALLAGTMSVYALISMERRRAMVSRELILTTTNALTQARKLGAAEAGIHPAASLSADSSAEGVLATLVENSSIKTLIDELASIHGAIIVRDDETSSADDKFGNPSLQTTILRELLAFCEASPDPYGVLNISATLLRSAIGARTLGQVHNRSVGEVRKDEQLRIATTISRTAGVSKTLGLADAQAPFWDPSLLRGIHISPLPANAVILDASELYSTNKKHRESPLLYVPNSSRPQTAKKQATQMLLGQSRQFVVSLQNPSDIALDIETLSVVASELQLDTETRPFVLGPRRLQRVAVMVTPREIGSSALEGCTIQISGCHRKFFPISDQAPPAESNVLIKRHGQIAKSVPLYPAISSGTTKSPVSHLQVQVIPEQPMLSIERISVLESNVMLLDGETKSFQVEVKNVSSTPAVVSRIVGMLGILQVLNMPSGEASIKPGGTFIFEMSLTGKTGLTEAHADFFYSADNPPAVPEFARKLSLTLEVTVNNAMRLQNPSIGPANEDKSFALSFDFGNAWPKPLAFQCQLTEDAQADIEMNVRGTLAPGQVERVHLTVKRWPSLIECNDVAAELRSRLNITWEGDGRAGHVDMKQLEMSTEMLRKVRGAPIYMSLQLAEGSVASVGRFTVVQVQLENRTSTHSAPLCLQYQVRTQDGRVCDSRQMAIAGPSQHLVPPIPGNGTTSMAINICPLTMGTFDVVATMRNIDLSGASGTSQEEWEVTQNVVLKVE